MMTKSEMVLIMAKNFTGAMQQTSTYYFFCNSNIDVYQKMCKKMQQWNSVVTSKQQGYDLVSAYD